MSVTAGVSDTIIAIRDKLKGKIGQTKVKRYWPGKAPEWADDNDEDGDIRMARVAELEKAFPIFEETDFMRKDDPRLRRLAESRIDNREEVREDHRRIRQAEIVSTIEEERRREEGLDLEDEDEDALEERRRRIREKLLQRQQEEAALMPEEEEEEVEEEEEEEESEYETDSEEETTGIAMVKPVFVPKSERDTIAERERLEAEERALEEAVKRRMEERRVETKQIVVEKIREDQEIQRNMESEANIADVDTDDDVNEAEEYEAWKAREIARIKRDRDDRESMLKEKEEIERVRNMTEEERREWERKNPKPTGQSKQKWRFMQKYYHKGAFFQTNPDDHAGTAKADNIYTRDFSDPTGEDKMDKTILPKVMQVKHFGRSGRTKWTHLVNEDTTDWNNPWTYNDALRAKYNAKMAGMSAPIAKPKGSKKLKDWETR
ncbi:microfibrillar-associated protein 1-like [Olea europaea var. sylvestris]|uniref:Microfibrillar-associated 1 n=1 Tax=Olea europaea subsp. europaea TaxID=158383 RepID=A0A8S0RSJ3_OLEEU|nr:microfibrillar-associated protein 1-like [Olea europaea var. sylvestris]XP_022891245.1 microfibrillar-associated protein 1-like [Olea europaea var. sylvestris]CAA2982531.1 microfibrillar-associated 1 [Olea europaea subsp. europaea]